MELEWVELLLPRLSDLLEAVGKTNWTIEKIAALVGSAFGIVASIISVWIRWRNTGRRRVARLREFIDSEEARLRTVHSDLAEIVKRPMPSERIRHTFILGQRHGAFPNWRLKRLLRTKGWGGRILAARRIDKAINKANVQREFSLGRADYYRNEKLLGHILRGALDDANGHHEAALDHFKLALAINRDDVQDLNMPAYSRSFQEVPTSQYRN